MVINLIAVGKTEQEALGKLREMEDRNYAEAQKMMKAQGEDPNLLAQTWEVLESNIGFDKEAGHWVAVKRIHP